VHSTYIIISIYSSHSKYIVSFQLQFCLFENNLRTGAIVRHMNESLFWEYKWPKRKARLISQPERDSVVTSQPQVDSRFKLFHFLIELSRSNCEMSEGYQSYSQGRAKWFLVGGWNKKFGPPPIWAPPQKNFPETKNFFRKILATGEGGEVPKFFSNTKFT
jgi:hypothetical protein